MRAWVCARGGGGKIRNSRSGRNACSLFCIDPCGLFCILPFQRNVGVLFEFRGLARDSCFVLSGNHESFPQSAFVSHSISCAVSRSRASRLPRRRSAIARPALRGTKAEACGLGSAGPGAGASLRARTKAEEAGGLGLSPRACLRVRGARSRGNPVSPLRDKFGSRPSGVRHAGQGTRRRRIPRCD